jgi:hypothetical protein
MKDSHLDPWVAEQIDAALAPHAARLSAQELEWMRARLVDATRDDEGLAQAIRGAVVREPDDSGSLPLGRPSIGEGQGSTDGAAAAQAQHDDASDKSA